MHFPRATRIDLLHTEQLYRYRSNPALISADLAGLRAGDWVVVDEAQKVPDLLDEIHGLYESRRLHFAITGSSARKLRRADVNLLAGRAVRCDFFPLVWAEIEQPSLLGPSGISVGHRSGRSLRSGSAEGVAPRASALASTRSQG